MFVHKQSETHYDYLYVYITAKFQISRISTFGHSLHLIGVLVGAGPIRVQEVEDSKSGEEGKNRSCSC
jgi:hypothetical protein